MHARRVRRVRHGRARQRRHLRRFIKHGVACEQRRRSCVDAEQKRIVPGADGAHDAQRLALHALTQRAAACVARSERGGSCGRQSRHARRRCARLAARCGSWLAKLARQERCELSLTRAKLLRSAQRSGEWISLKST